MDKQLDVIRHSSPDSLLYTFDNSWKFISI